MYVSHELGRIGENIIADYITKLGYKVVERNFECNQGEIDIIAKDKEELVFIEVKTRTDISYGEASEAVTNTKKRHLINSIKYYIYKQIGESAYKNRCSRSVYKQRKGKSKLYKASY